MKNKIQEQVLKYLEKELGHNCYVEEDCKKAISRTIELMEEENKCCFTYCSNLSSICFECLGKEVLENCKKQKADFRKMISSNRKEILYVLTYGFKNSLTEKEEKNFMKMFINLYEDHLLARLNDKIDEWYDGEAAIDAIKVKHIKEFIKLLKDELRESVKDDHPRESEMEFNIDIINKLAGKELANHVRRGNDRKRN